MIVTEPGFPGTSVHILTVTCFSADTPGVGGRAVTTWSTWMDAEAMIKIAEFVVASAKEIIEKRAKAVENGDQ